MRRLAPYQSGLWLAEYLNIGCQLCRVYRSVPQRKLNTPQALGAHASYPLLKIFSATLNKGLLCPRCHDSIIWLPPSFNIDINAGRSMVIQAASYYDYPMCQAIRAFKQQEDITKLPFLVHALRQLPRPHGCHAGNSVIIPMPTTGSRLIKRGFDPVTILSAYLSKHWQIPLWQGVQRIDNAVSQQGLSRAERLTNLNDAFTLSEPPSVKRLLLFDDVATTGASLQALAHTLHAESVMVQSVKNKQPVNNSSATTEAANPYYHINAYAIAHGSPL